MIVYRVEHRDDPTRGPYQLGVGFAYSADPREGAGLTSSSACPAPEYDCNGGYGDTPLSRFADNGNLWRNRELYFGFRSLGQLWNWFRPLILAQLAGEPKVADLTVRVYRVPKGCVKKGGKQVAFELNRAYPIAELSPSMIARAVA